MTTADVLAIIGTLGTLIIAAAGWLTYLHNVRSHRITTEHNVAADFRTALERRFREADEAIARRDEVIERRFKGSGADIDAIATQVHGLELELARNYITRVDILLAMERMGTRLEGSITTANGKMDSQNRDLNSKVDRLLYSFNRMKALPDSNGNGA